MGRHGPKLDRVYPRAGGGTCTPPVPTYSVDGLSPRGRGNRPGEAHIAGQRRSIPARAGQPTSPASRARSTAVYPRACGATARRRARGLSVSGLSPRVRGNRRKAALHVSRQGSIPARAGQPRAPGRASREGQVYPRACGATPLRGGRLRPARGLSPRVRGNPD